MEPNDGKELIDKVLEKEHLDLGGLARRIGYSERTLRGVRYGEVPLSAKLQNWLQEMLQDSKNEESHGQVQNRVRESVPVYRPLSMQPQTPTDAEIIELMTELLEDYKTAKDLKKRWLADQIRELAKGLGPDAVRSIQSKIRP